jgi:hypothetical protein
MTQTSVTPQIHEPLDIGRNVPTQIAFDFKLAVDNVADLADLYLGKVVGTGIEVNPSLT